MLYCRSSVTTAMNDMSHHLKEVNIIRPPTSSLYFCQGGVEEKWIEIQEAMQNFSTGDRGMIEAMDTFKLMLLLLIVVV